MPDADYLTALTHFLARLVGAENTGLSTGADYHNGVALLHKALGLSWSTGNIKDS